MVGENIVIAFGTLSSEVLPYEPSPISHKMTMIAVIITLGGKIQSLRLDLCLLSSCLSRQAQFLTR